MVSALPKELEYRVEKHKYEKLEVIQICYDPREPITNPKYQLVNKPSWTGAHQMEPPSPIQALGVNPFPSRFVTRTVPKGDFARRRWEEPITTTK